MSLLDMSMSKSIAYDKNKEEEIVERTNPFKGEFSPSSLSYAQCLRKFLFEKVYKLKSVHPATALIFGVAIHKGVEVFYTNRNSKELSFDSLKANVIATFVQEWSKYKIAGDSRRNMDVGILLLSQYCDTYRHENVAFESIDIEGAQWIKMPNETMLLCKLDRVGSQDGSLCVIDTKTTSMYLNDIFFLQFQSHLQTSLYYYAMESIMGRCDYVLIDGIKTPINGARSTTPQFARRSFMRTELQIEEAIRTYCRKTDYMMDGISLSGKERLDHFYCDQNRCADYGGCPFSGICTHGINHPMVGVDYVFENEEGEEAAREDFNS